MTGIPLYVSFEYFWPVLLPVECDEAATVDVLFWDWEDLEERSLLPVECEEMAAVVVLFGDWEDREESLLVLTAPVVPRLK